MPAHRHFATLLIGLATGLCLVGDTLAQPTPETSESIAVRDALQKLNGIIGGWRGTGQPRRGSNRGAWREDAEFIWDFSGPLPAIKLVVQEGKLAQQAIISYNVEGKLYTLSLKEPDGTESVLTGNWDGNQLVFTSMGESEQDRITITALNEKRTLMLFESRNTSAGAFNRVAEVGYTREGTRLALPGGGQPECIVTGGAASIAVMYKGQTYYVCCTGCKLAFEDDPEGILAEAAERARQAKARN